MRLSEAIETLLVATRANGCTMRTVETYACKLKPLLEALGDVPVEEISTADLRCYVTAMMDQATVYGDHPTRPEISRPLSPFTIHSRVRHMRRLFAFLHEEGALEDNPAARVKAPAPRRDKPKGVEWGDVALMLASTAGGSVTDLRDRAILLFLADTGCRAGGLCGLRRQDLDVENRSAVVSEKRGKSRRVFFGRCTATALRDWLALRPLDPQAWVFVSLGPRGGQIKPGRLTHILKRRASRAAVTGPVNCHAFRHGFARAYLQDGGDLATLAALLGHEDTSVTREFYAIFTGAELQELHGRHSPVRRLEEAMYEGD